jgi:hypothetical protein
MMFRETLAARLLSKLVLDILPAVTASLIGGLLFTHYGLGRVPEPAAQAAPASPEMMQLLRDEHGLMVAFLNAELARERTGLTSEGAGHNGSSEAATPARPPAQAPVAAAAKPAPAHVRIEAAALASAPLVIAQVQPADSVDGTSQIPQSLITKTVRLKDHVISVTHRVVAVLGSIPGWIGLTHVSATGPIDDMVAPS